MAGSAAFDFVVNESLKKSVSDAPLSEQNTGPKCNIKWNPTIDDIEEANEMTQDFMDHLTAKEKVTVNAWEQLLQSTGPPRIRDQKLKALEDDKSKPLSLTFPMLDSQPDNLFGSNDLTDTFQEQTDTFQEQKMPNAAEEEKVPEASQQESVPDVGQKMAEASQQESVPDVDQKMAEASQEQKMPDAAEEKTMPEASQEQKMPDAAEEKKMPEASQEQKMPDAAEEEKMPESEVLQHESEEKSPKDADAEKPPEGDVPEKSPEVQRSKKRPREQGAEKVTFAVPEKSPEVQRSKKRPREQGAEKVTFANRTRPKTPMMLNMWESTRVAFNEKIKPLIQHPAKNEPEFYKYCVKSWMTPEQMEEADFFQQASAMADDWLRANEDKVLQKS
eukprot:s586_g25.t1